MVSEFAYCPVCMYRTRLISGTKANDYSCPRHGVACIYSGEPTNLLWQG